MRSSRQSSKLDDSVISEYSRLRNSSVVTIDIIDKNKEQFKTISNFKYAIETINSVLNKFKPEEILFRTKFSSMILLNEGTVMIGKAKNGIIYQKILVDEEGIKDEIKIFEGSKDYRLTKLNDLSFALIRKEKKLTSSQTAKSSVFESKGQIFSVNQGKGHYFFSQTKPESSIYSLIPEETEKNYIKYLNKKLKNPKKLSLLEKIILNSGIVSNLDENIKSLKILLTIRLSKKDKSFVVCFRDKTQKNIEKFATVFNEKCKLRFSRKVRLDSLSPKDNTTVMIWPNHEKERALYVGTAQGNIIIYDIKYPGRFFTVNTDQYFISDLYLNEITKSQQQSVGEAQGPKTTPIERKIQYIYSLSRDKRLVKTRVLSLNSIKLMSIKHYFLLTLNRENDTKIRLVKLENSPEIDKSYRDEFKSIVEFLNFDELEDVLGLDLKLTGHNKLEFIERGDSLMKKTNLFNGRANAKKFHSIVYFKNEIMHHHITICAGNSNSLFLFNLNEISINSELSINFKDISPKLKEFSGINQIQSDSTSRKLEIFEFLSHSDEINALCKFENILVSGSGDGVIKIWMIDLNNPEISIYLLNTFSAPVSHSESITSLSILGKQKVILSASYDLSIKIWKLKSFKDVKSQTSALMSQEDLTKYTEKMLIFTISNLQSIVRFIVPIKNDEYFITCCAFGYINIWSSQTYTAIFSMNLNTTVRFFGEFHERRVEGTLLEKVEKHDKEHIVYSDGKKIYAFQYLILDKTHANSQDLYVKTFNDGKNEEVENFVINDQEENEFKAQFNPEFVRLMGYNMNEIYQAMNYFADCMDLNKTAPPFNPSYDKFVVFPYLITSQHIYAFHNLPEHLTKSLHNGTNLSESTMKQSPLSIAVSRDYEECTLSIIKYLKHKLNESPYFINFISDTSLIEMNYSGQKSLSLFYQEILVLVNKSSNPRFVPLSLELPLYKPYADAVVNYNFLFNSEFQEKDSELGQGKNSSKTSNFSLNDTGKSVIFMRSAISVSMIIGTERSLALVQSIVNCKNENIFSTPFIKAYIDYKMPRVIKIMSFFAVFYYFYIVCLMIFLSMSEVNMAVVGAIFICKIVLFIFEIYKIIAYGKDYFSVHWNVLDFTRMFVANILFLMIFYEYILLLQPSIYAYIRSLFFAITLISYSRSISYFRLMESTRNFTHLLWEILKKSVSFMLFMIYNILCVGYLFYIADIYSDNLLIYLERSFLLIYGPYSPETGDDSIVWMIYVGSFIINNWMILNFMIAVYSDIFEDVKNNSDLQVYKTKAEMVYEIEVIMTWKRKNVIVPNPNYFENGDQNEYIEYTPPGYLGKLIERYCKCCKRKQNQSELSPSQAEIEIKDKEDKKVKEYLHVCKSIEEFDDIDEKLGRLKALGNKIRFAIQRAHDVSTLVSKTVSEADRTIDLARNTSKNLRHGIRTKEIQYKDFVKSLTSEILKDLITLTISHDEVVRRKCQENLEEKIELIMKSD